MLILANLLFLASGLLLMLLAFSSERGGPEGPVGAHMVTAPLALGQVIALALAIGRGHLEPIGIPAVLLYLALPGNFVALTIVPILATGRSQSKLARLAMVAAIAGAGLVIDGESLLPGSKVVLWIGTLGAASATATGYGVLLALFWQQQKNAIARAADDATRQSDFERSQAEWQLGEWNKLPADAELWQLITLTHAFHPEVKAKCHARIAAFADLDAQMNELLGTGWAEHAMAYLRDFYPRSRAPLAAALNRHWAAECDRWRKTLDDSPRPETWFYNMVTIVDVAEKTAADGGDVRESMQRWADMLRGRRGLEPLAHRTAQLARGPQ